MKKLIFALIAATSMLVSCQLSGPIDYLPYVVGQWVTTNDGTRNSLATDSIKVVAFNPDGSVNYAYGKSEENGAMQWVEGGGMSFEIVDQTIVIQTPPGAPVSRRIKMEIGYVSDFAMSCFIVDYTINGVQTANNEVVTFEKSVFTSLKYDLVGIWQSPPNGNGDTQIWNFKQDGGYDFYLYDPINKVYKSKIIDQNKYQLYGRYLVNTFTNEPAEQPVSQSSKVWQITYLGSATMVWRSRNANGELQFYQLTMIGKLP